MIRSLNTAICLCYVERDQQENINKQKLESTKENVLFIGNFLSCECDG
ncbi:hypothetical protein SAMN05443252_104286 [Bacillus sp. OV322]|nr:hypothetical protein SAMN05443252_104286 [Bacillus sp. OV322]